MREFADGVYTLPLDFEHEGRHRILWPAVFETDGGLLLVDTGLPSQFDALTAALADGGFEVGDVAYVVVTHRDVDHTGTLRDIAAAAEPTVIAHTDEVAPIAEHTVPADIELVGGESIRTTAGDLRIVATPGHTAGHISLYCPDERLLVAADALTAEDGFGGPRPDVTADVGEATDSVGRLAELDVERTLCYHGGLVEHDSDEIAAIYRDIL